MKSILTLAVVTALFTGPLWARNEGVFVKDEAPSGALRFEKPTFSPEGLCASNMKGHKGCAFKLVLVAVDGRKIFLSTKRKEYRLPPGEHTIVVQNGPIGSFSSWRGRRGDNKLKYNKYGHPGEVTINITDGDVYQVYARRKEKTDDNPFGWEVVVRRG